MPRSLTRISLAILLLLSSELWALGLGDVRLESALNEPLRAEIELLSASPEELTHLTVGLASAETFDRYGLDRPFYLQDITFELVRTGRADGNYIRVRSLSPMSEPFLTFLVEASWSRGRLLREYTVLLDPPTFAPPSASQPAPQVTAPQRSTTADSGRIERAPAQTRPAPSVSRTGPKPQPVADDTPYDSAAGGDIVVRRGQTLWGIASANRPDSRLTMNQTMLAIYEANPQAFGGNINLLLEGGRIRIPSADEIYRIDRRDALSEVQRQNTSWEGGATAPTPVAGEDSRPSLTLVPPDEEPVGVDTAVDTGVDTGIDSVPYDEPMTREQEILDRIAIIEAADVPVQRSLIEIRSNELAALREELANIRGEVYVPVDDPFVDDAADDEMADDEPIPDFDEIMADDSAEDTADDAVDDAADEATQVDTPISTRQRPEPSLIDKIMEWATSIWAIIGAALLVAIGVLFWFMRRGGGDDEPEAWGTPLDADDVGGDPLSATESLRAPTREDESIVVVEQDSAINPVVDTMEVEAATPAPETGDFGSLEDTFSSDTAINLDQSDPIAEADFHMAYGLYDQAADLINGALEVEPERHDLLTKLCEIYFVWGNREAFIDAAERLQRVTGGDSADWDKIVIMGQQIAADHTLFAGAGVAGVTKEVDLSFESEADDAGALDMDFGADSGGADIVDLGAPDGDAGETAEPTGTFDQEIDFNATGEMPTVEQPSAEPTVEMPKADSTVETPTIEEQFAGFDGTAELPSIPDALEHAVDSSGRTADATAEINLDDLGLDLDGLDETEVAAFGDDDATELASLDDLDSTGKNPQVDPSATGVQQTLDPGSTGFSEELDLDDELAATSEMRLAADETGQNPMADAVVTSDSGIEESLLDATGRTQVLSEGMAVDTFTPADDSLGDDEATLLASGLDDDDDYDFAKTEALPPDTYSGDLDPDVTGELPAIGGTDVDLDLDDLTAALKVSDISSDTIDRMRNDETVEQPRASMTDDHGMETQELSADDMSDDLHEARTMTEVGTKLDLARAYVDMGDPAGARSILEEVLDEGDDGQRQQAQQLLDSLPS